jgi:hypothetical protein
MAAGAREDELEVGKMAPDHAYYHAAPSPPPRGCCVVLELKNSGGGIVGDKKLER